MNEKYRKLEYIANGIHAANKINEINSSSHNMRDGSSVKAGKLTRLNEIAGVIAQYYPGPHGRIIGDAAGKSAVYSETYRNVKRQINSSRGKNIDAGTMINTLRTIKPALGGQQLHMVDKIIKIYDIIKS